MTTATCGHTLTEEEDLGYPVIVKSSARDGTRAVDYMTVCAECRDWWHATDAVLEPGTENGWLAHGDNTMTHDPVNHPKHYTSSPAKCECGRGIECIQIAEHMSFCLGNALKYIWRSELKNDAIEDLKKARWYIDREIERRTKSLDLPVKSANR